MNAGHKRRFIKLCNFFIQVTQNSSFSRLIDQVNHINRHPWSLALIFRLTFKMGGLWRNINNGSRNLIFHILAKIDWLQQIELRFASSQNCLSIAISFVSDICQFLIKRANKTKTFVFSTAINKNLFNFWRIKRRNCQVHFLIFR